ncbi:hypothetical protein D1227_06265 [Henriciella mobilis]|uniref:hypothetical protein n=1 Tax=Henriciella mobilis TaxID=2305467 RepID=UPI000E66A1F6|nr:hypothetical protein [Henriciella mobilis]RIJ15984.1 hypothetical protein D1231_09335 [Henriciella mobilis]RIJ21194.1 hypothetical protein D1227_12875 [Henriciella mobilis]RIJ23105.1 hypothetical protein D1227_06265 [Henriciella mobilis]
MADTHPILSRIEAHLAASGQTPTAFGVAALSDPNFVFDLRDGRDLRRDTVKRIEIYLEEQGAPEAVQP